MRGEGDDDTPETDEADGEPTVSVVIRGVRRGRDLQRADTAAATEDINKNSPKPSQTAGATTSAFTLLAAPSSNLQSLDGAAEAPAPGQAAEVATVAPPVLVKSESPMMKMKGGLAFAGTMLAMASRVKAKARRAKLVVAARTSVAGGALLQPWLVTMGNELCVKTSNLHSTNYARLASRRLICRMSSHSGALRLGLHRRQGSPSKRPRPRQRWDVRDLHRESPPRNRIRP